MINKKADISRNHNDSSSELGDLIAIFTKIDFRVFWARLVQRRNIILLVAAPIIFCVVAAFMAKVYISDTWEAKCVLLRQIKNTNMQKDMPQIFNPIDVDTIMKAIQTRDNKVKVIKQLDLNISVDSLSSKIEVTKQKNGNIIIITAKDKNRQTASDIANTLAEVFFASYVSLLNNSTREILNYYETNSIKIEKEIQSLEAQLQIYLKENKVISIEGETSSKFQQLNEMELKLMEYKMQKTALTIRSNDIKAQLVGMKEKIELSYTIATNEKELVEKQNQLAFLSQKYTNENPKVVSLLEEIEKLKNEKKENMNKPPIPEDVTYGPNIQRQELEMEKFNVESQLSSMNKNISELENSITIINEKLGNLSNLESTYSQIKRKIELNKNLLTSIQQIISVSGLSSESSVSDIAILEKAVPPTYPESSKRKLLAVVGGILGFIAALIFIILPEFLDFTFKSDREIQNILKIKVLGMLPDKDSVSDSVYYSAWQIFYDGLISSASLYQKPMIVLCSSVEGVGKTFVIKSLCQMLKEKSLKMLYIDSVFEVTEDIKNNLINNYLYNYHVSESEIKVNNISENLDKVYFHLDDISYRHPLDKERLKSLIENYRKEYDYIVCELFVFKRNKQLFSTFTVVSDLTLLVSRFKVSNKFADRALLGFIRERNTRNIAGFMNDVVKHYYKYLA